MTSADSAFDGVRSPSMMRAQVSPSRFTWPSIGSQGRASSAMTSKYPRWMSASVRPTGLVNVRPEASAGEVVKVAAPLAVRIGSFDTTRGVPEPAGSSILPVQTSAQDRATSKSSNSRLVFDSRKRTRARMPPRELYPSLPGLLGLLFKIWMLTSWASEEPVLPFFTWRTSKYVPHSHWPVRPGLRVCVASVFAVEMPSTFVYGLPSETAIAVDADTASTPAAASAANAPDGLQRFIPTSSFILPPLGKARSSLRFEAFANPKNPTSSSVGSPLGTPSHCPNYSLTPSVAGPTEHHQADATPSLIHRTKRRFKPPCRAASDTSRRSPEPTFPAPRSWSRGR